MNRTQRATKRDLRAIENGRSSFKKIYLNGAKAFDNNIDSDGIKQMQNELKAARKRTREFSRKNSLKEEVEV
jgi:hypothetical protein